MPTRVPPLPVAAVFAMAEVALRHRWQHFALTLVLGAHGLLRTGEISKLLKADIHLDASLTSAVVNLGSTKGSHRKRTKETVSIDLPWLVCFAKAAANDMLDGNRFAPADNTFRKKFSEIAHLLGIQGYRFKPYSLRRGGATEL